MSMTTFRADRSAACPRGALVHRRETGQSWGVTSSPAAPPSDGGVPSRLPMVEMVEHLLAGLTGARLVLDTPDAPTARELRDRVASQVRNHLLPRRSEAR